MIVCGQIVMEREREKRESGEREEREREKREREGRQRTSETMTAKLKHRLQIDVGTSGYKVTFLNALYM